MKIYNIAILFPAISIGLVICSNGCMTQSVIKHAEGHPEEADWFWTTDAPQNPKPHPEDYVLLPLTVPADVATAPFIFVFYCGEDLIGVPDIYPLEATINTRGPF